MHNVNAELEYSGDSKFLRKVKIPEPQYGEVEFNFKPINVQAYWIESTNDRDIIINLLYCGDIRLVYDALVETQLSAIMSLHNL